MPLTKNEVGEDISKPLQEWNELEKRKASLNSKFMNALFCTVDKKEFHRVSSCESANENWHKLEVVYEDTNQVKESKISRYTRQYKLLCFFSFSSKLSLFITIVLHIFWIPFHDYFLGTQQFSYVALTMTRYKKIAAQLKDSLMLTKSRINSKNL